MMSEPEPILDYIILRVPPHVDPDGEDARKLMNQMAEFQVMGQYKPKDRPKAIVLDPIEWLITSDWEEVERTQPAHQCAACLAGNDQAVAFLKEHPDQRLALGNLKYWEIR
jgi:hypothetical protein